MISTFSYIHNFHWDEPPSYYADIRCSSSDMILTLTLGKEGHICKTKTAPSNSQKL
jgi:hypothetical protein